MDTPPDSALLYVLNRAAVARHQKQLGVPRRVRAAPVRSEVYRWGSAPHRDRIEVYDFARRQWLRPDRELQRRLNKLSTDQLRAMLRNMPYGMRLAPDYVDVPDLDGVLDAALAQGRLDLGGRSYKLARSRTGNIVVTGHAFGHVTYSREALLDVIQRGHF